MVNRCGDCGKAWQETRSGQVPVTPERYEAAACDAEVSDVRDGPARVTKTVPPMIRRHVLDRDGHRCRVPGCSSVGFLHVHHEPGREVSGHDPARMTPLCDEHHNQRHLGLLEIREEGDARFRFFLADGTELDGASAQVAPPPVEPDEDPASCSYEQRASDSFLADGTELGGASAEVAPPPVEPDEDPAGCSYEQRASGPVEGCVDEDGARRALRRLGMRAAEVTAALRSAREALRAHGETVTLEALLREALPQPRSG